MMIRFIVMIGAAALLSGCGGGRGYNPGGAPSGGVVLFAQGPISSACMSSDRKAATRARCGCIQAVADRELSNGDQRRGVKLFKDPHEAQETRQSDRANDERFWLAWKAFGNTAETLCAST